MPAKDQDEYAVLHPRTAIITYDLIPWKLQMSVGGAIKAMLYGEDSSAGKDFYSSPVARENKRILTEFAGQIYAYLNVSISEYADIKDYKFRVWVDVKVNPKTGKISDKPIFDVELYRYVGRVTAQGVEAEDASAKVSFVGNKGDLFITPFIIKAMRRAERSTKSLKVEFYEDRSSAPKLLKSKLLGAFPTLIIDEESFAIKPKNKEDGTGMVPYVEDGSRQVELQDSDSVLRFITDKTGLKPEVFGLSTGFQRVDDELEKISAHIQEGATTTEKELDTINFVAELGLDNVFKTLSARLKKLNADGSSVLEKRLNHLKAEFEEEKRGYNELKTQRDAELEHIQVLQGEHQKNMIEFGAYDVQRMKSITNRRRIEGQLLDLMEEGLPELEEKIDGFGKEGKDEQGTGEKAER